MEKHLKPIYVTYQINGKPMPRVFVDPEDVLNVIPLSTLKKLGKFSKDLLLTSMKMSYFI